MTHTIIYAGPGGIAPSTKALYEKALKGLDFEWITVKGPAGGTSFESEVEAKRGSDGRLLPVYLKQSKRPVTTVTLIAFSAGYGFARAMFKDSRDREAIDAFLAVDAIHASIVGGGGGTVAQKYAHAGAMRRKHPDDPRPYLHSAQLSGFVDFCRRAAKGEAIACLISSEITPYYASTRETSNAITLSLDIENDAGDFSVVHQKGNGKAAHIKACNVTGPEAARVRLKPWLMARWADDTDGAQEEASELDGEASVAPWRDPELTLGQRCVLWSFEESKTVSELTANWSPRISEYFKNIRRLIRGKERKLGLDRGNWCAAGATFAEVECALPGDRRLTKQRASGIEMQRDAVKAGTWRPLKLWLSGQWEPAVGDYVIWNRGRSTGPQAWWRHVARVCQVSEFAKLVITIDGNRNNRWSLQRGAALTGGKVGPGQTFKEPARANPDLLGFIEVDRRESSVGDLGNICLGPGLEVDGSKTTAWTVKLIDAKIDKFAEALTSG